MKEKSLMNFLECILRAVKLEKYALGKSFFFFFAHLELMRSLYLYNNSMAEQKRNVKDPRMEI